MGGPRTPTLFPNRRSIGCFPLSRTPTLVGIFRGPVSIPMSQASPGPAVTEIGGRRSQTLPRPRSESCFSPTLHSSTVGATFEDEATSEALNTLSDLYSPATSSTVVSLANEDVTVNELDLESSKDVPSLLRAVSPGEAAVKARRHLRRDIESKLGAGSLSCVCNQQQIFVLRLSCWCRTPMYTFIRRSVRTS